MFAGSFDDDDDADLDTYDEAPKHNPVNARFGSRSDDDDGDEGDAAQTKKGKGRKKPSNNDQPAARRSDIQMGILDSMHSQFDAIKAACGVAARIARLLEKHEEVVLPHHSRTLAFSPLKQLFDQVALVCNKRVGDLYAGFDDTDVGATERANVGDAAVRRMKADIQEYVDRTLDPEKFFQTEAVSGSFTAAYYTCLRMHEELNEANVFGPNHTPANEFDAEKVSEILAQHVDMKSNLVLPDVKADQISILIEPLNWYSESQLDWGPETTNKAIQEIFKEKLEHYRNANAPTRSLTLLDIAILGGLNPLNFAVSKHSPNLENYLNRNFFEECIRILKRNATSHYNGTLNRVFEGRLNREIDLATVLFNIPLSTPVDHRSWLPYERYQQPSPYPDPGNLVYGARPGGKDADPGPASRSQFTETEAGIRGGFVEERDVYNSFADGTFKLHAFCFDCLEHGTAIFMRIVHALIKEPLEDLRKNQKTPPAALHSFCRCVAYTMLENEIQNPRLPSINASAARKRARDNKYGLSEAKYQLKKALGLPVGATDLGIQSQPIYF